VLHATVRNGFSTAVEVLLAVGANASADREGMAPLSWAARNGHEAVVELLLARHDVKADSKDGGSGRRCRGRRGKGTRRWSSCWSAGCHCRGRRREGMRQWSSSCRGAAASRPTRWMGAGGRHYNMAVVKLLLAGPHLHLHVRPLH